MKQATAYVAGTLLAICLAMPAAGRPDPGDDPGVVLARLQASAHDAVSKAQWGKFSKNLVRALKEDHDGIREAALRMIIKYGDQLEVKEAVFNVMRIYRDHDNPYLRRMALVALGRMKSTWAIRFLERSESFEKIPELKHTIRAVTSKDKAPV